MQCIAQHFEFDEFIDGQRNAVLYTRVDIEHRHRRTDGRVTHNAHSMRRLRLLCWAAAPYAWDGWVRTPSTADQAPTRALAQGAERGAREWHEMKAADSVSTAFPLCRIPVNQNFGELCVHRRPRAVIVS